MFHQIDSAFLKQIKKHISIDRQNIYVSNELYQSVQTWLQSHCIAAQLTDTLGNNNPYDCIIISHEDNSQDIFTTLKKIPATSDCQYFILCDNPTIMENALSSLFETASYHKISEQCLIVNKQISEWERIEKIADYCYHHIIPSKDNDQQDGEQILRDGYGLCGSSSRAAKFLAQYYGFNAKVVTFRMEGLPFGRGEKKWDTHTVCEIQKTTDRQWIVCDAMANICYPYSLKELLHNPMLADEYREKINFQPDERWIHRKYDWYSTTKAYRLAVSMKYPKVWYSQLKKYVQKVIRTQQ